MTRIEDDLDVQGTVRQGEGKMVGNYPNPPSSAEVWDVCFSRGTQYQYSNGSWQRVLYGGEIMTYSGYATLPYTTEYTYKGAQYVGAMEVEDANGVVQYRIQDASFVFSFASNTASAGRYNEYVGTGVFYIGSGTTPTGMVTAIQLHSDGRVLIFVLNGSSYTEYTQANGKLKFGNGLRLTVKQ